MAKSNAIKKSAATKYFLATGALVLIYCLLTFFSPVDPASLARFNITVGQTRLLQLSLALPIIAIWLLATYGAASFKVYAEKIKASDDGRALNKVADGLLTLVYASLIGAGIFGTLGSYARAAGMRIPFTIANKYVTIILGLIAFGAFFAGSLHLLQLVKTKVKGSSPLMALVAVGSLAYIYAQMTYPYRNATPDPTKYSSSFLPDPLIVLTILIPTIVMWVLGALAASNVNAYRRAVKGLFYKEALGGLSRGVLFIVFFGIALQLLTGLSEYFASLNLQGILIFIYIILVFYSVGWVIIARGAKKLEKIEDVV